MKVVNKFFYVFLWVFIVLAIVAIIGFFSIFTNGFREDLKTFYLIYRGNLILSEESKVSLIYNKENRFEIKYQLGFGVNKTSDKTYTVEIIPNGVYSELTYTVDGEEHVFGDIEDFTDIFVLEKTEEFFTVFPKAKTLNTVLSLKYPGHKVEVSDEYAEVNNFYYTLKVTPYKSDIVYNINFNFEHEINLDNGSILF